VVEPSPTPETQPARVPDPPIVATVDPVDPAPRVLETPKVQQCLKVAPVAAITLGANVTFSAERCVDDDTAVTLWYRPSGSDGWLSVAMPFRLGAYRTSVKVDDRFASGLDYYVETRGAAHGSRANPHRVGVR
jgi:hypothetical protein